MRKKLLCAILAFALLAGAVSAVILSQPTGSREVSDYFFVQLYSADDQILSKYKISLTGTISGSERFILSVTPSHESGDECRTECTITGYNAVVTVTHPTQGYWEYRFILNTDGTFSGL